MAGDGDHVLLRDDDDPGVTLRIPKTSWRRFVAGVKDGEFDVGDG